jgi:CRISPR system Cascade subunit CasC
MIIQIHILQNYVPSNLNRDDTGSPKDAIFGGYRRGRISSQCLKRSIRLSDVFEAEFRKDDLIAARTRTLPTCIKNELEKLKTEEETLKSIVERVSEIGKKANKEEAGENDSEDENEKATGDLKTKQLIFLAPGEAKIIAEKLLALYTKLGKKEFAKLKIKDLEVAIVHEMPRSIDIAMFGRMTTSQAFENVQGAVQVAHALSTNAITQEFDYYTAMDDLKPDSEPGADMIGDVEFNSSTYYKYINIYWDGLVENLGKDNLEVVRRAVLAFLEAAVFAQPTGKQNSFAAHNLPDFVLVEVSKKNVPVSYANAFLKPVAPKGDRTLMDMSVDSLNNYITQISDTFALKPDRAFIATHDYKITGVTAQRSLPDLKAWLAEKIG